MRDTFIKELLNIAKIDSSCILITGDLGFGVFDQYRRELPSQFINVGVAEQNMTALACGLSLNDYTVFTYSIGNFPTLRCLEQIRNDICYHDANVTIVSIGAGFSYGQLGVSHFATEDLSILRAIPNLTLFTPTTDQDVRLIMREIPHLNGPKYLRLDKDFVEHEVECCEYNVGMVNTLREGEDVTILGVGGVVNEALAAATNLQKHGISVRVLSVTSLKPLDFTTIENAINETRFLVTLEENTLIGGLSGTVSEWCLRNGVFPDKFVSFGIPDEYPSIVGDQGYLRKNYGLDALSISDTIKSYFC